MPESSAKLDRVGGRPRVQVTYGVPIGDPIEKGELTFVVVVLAELSRHGETLSSSWSGRLRAHLIDRDVFDLHLEHIGPRLSLQVPNKLGGPESTLKVELRFGQMADFEPTSIAQQVEPLKKLLDMQQSWRRLLARLEGNDFYRSLFASVLSRNETGTLANIQADLRELLENLSAAVRSDNTYEQEVAMATTWFRSFLERVQEPGQVVSREVEANVQHWIHSIEHDLSAQLREIIHHPEFEKLEATWRGLRHLVFESDTGNVLKIRVVDVSKQALIVNFRKAMETGQSGLSAAISEIRNGESCGLIVGDYEFGPSEEDCWLLSKISQVAAAAHAPFVASVSPTMFNVDRFGDLPRHGDLIRILDDPEHAAWRAFRATEESRYVGLTLPRVRSRLPYGKRFNRIDEICFEEAPDGARADHAWMSAAWSYAVCITQAFSRYGWFARLRGENGGGKVAGLVNLRREPDEVPVPNTTEIALDDMTEGVLSANGLLPLLQAKNKDFAVFFGAQSCRLPDAVPGRDDSACKLNALLCALLFVRTLKYMAAIRRAVDCPIEEMRRWLNDWIEEFVCANPDSLPTAGEAARQPLQYARIELRPILTSIALNCFEFIAQLRLRFQFSDLTTTICLSGTVGPADLAIWTKR